MLETFLLGVAGGIVANIICEIAKATWHAVAAA